MENTAISHIWGIRSSRWFLRIHSPWWPFGPKFLGMGPGSCCDKPYVMNINHPIKCIQMLCYSKTIGSEFSQSEKTQLSWVQMWSFWTQKVILRLPAFFPRGPRQWCSGKKPGNSNVEVGEERFSDRSLGVCRNKKWGVWNEKRGYLAWNSFRT